MCHGNYLNDYFPYMAPPNDKFKECVKVLKVLVHKVC